MASITERSGRFFVRVRVKGYPTTAKTFTKRADAAAWARRVQSDMESGRWVAPSQEVPTLRKAMEDYEATAAARMKGAATYAYRFAEFKALPMASKLISEVTSTDLARWRDEQMKSLKPGTVVRKLAMLSSVFTWAMKERGWVTANPAARVSRPRVNDRRERVLSLDEQGYILRAAATSKARWLAPALTVLMNSAMRRGELFTLRVGDVDFGAAVAHLHDTKNGLPRDVPLCPASLAGLRELADMAGNKTAAKLVPVGEVGSVSTRFAVTLGRARTMYADDCASQAMEPATGFLHDVRLHDLRHHAVSKWASTGTLSMIQLQAISGHRTVKMLARYTHINASDLAARMAAVARAAA